MLIGISRAKQIIPEMEALGLLEHNGRFYIKGKGGE